MKQTAKKQPSGYVIYRGPSLLDGAPIVAVALTRSSNRKTGDMVQTYILREDVAPTEALRTGQDVSICGDCKHRPFNGGACYVVVCQGPTVVFKGLALGRYPEASPEDVGAMVSGRMVRLGTYGDPAAVPASVWEDLTAQAQGRTGYTHQWQNAALPAGHVARIGALCMASADSPEEAQTAQAQGLRYFRVAVPGETLGKREFICPASEEAGKVKTCATCGACNGSQKATGANPVIVVHGTKARRFIALRAS